MFTIKIKRKALRKLEKQTKTKHRNTHPNSKKRPHTLQKAGVCKLQGYNSTHRIITGNLRITFL